MPSALRHWRNALGVFVAFAVFALSLALGMRGSEWELLHPDEHLVAHWLEYTEDHAYVPSRAYPSGFFELARVFRWFEKRADRIAERNAEWVSQGEAGFTARRDSAPLHSKENMIIRGRRWCAVLMALSSLFFFLLALRVARNLPAAVAASLLYAFHPFIVEHAHYCESDASMMFSFTLALWLLAECLSAGRPEARDGASRWALALPPAAAFATGFALSCKYTLVPMALLPPVAAWLFAARRGWRISARAALALAAVALVCAGILAGTPFLAHEPARFFRRLHETSTLTYGETKRLLGEMADVPNARDLLKARSFLDQAAKFGWAWWAWFAVSLPAWFVPRFRRQLAGVPLFGAVFPVLAVLGFPWFRNQEFMPMLPFLCLTVALPVSASLDSFRCPDGPQGRKKRRAVFCASAACVVLFVISGIASGLRMASYFATVETRRAAREWLMRRLPKDRMFCTELYAQGVRRGMEEWRDNGNIHHVDRMTGEDWANYPARYVMRTPTMPARGTRNVWTGEFYPSNQARFDSFTNSATLLCAWRMPGRTRPTFAQPDLELWARRDAGAEAPAIDLPVYLARADVAVPYGSELFCLPDDRGLGPRDVLELSGVRSRVVLPDSDGRAYYAVATLPADAEGPAEIAWDGVFAPRRAKLAPGSAVLFRAPAPRLWASACEEVSVRLRRSHGATGARVAVTADSGLAAHWLRDAGDPKAAFDLLSSLDDADLDAAARYEGALAAEAMDVEPPAEWAEAAAEVRGRIGTARAMLDGGAPRSAVSICGVPLDVLDELGAGMSF